MSFRDLKDFRSYNKMPCCRRENRAMPL